MSAKGDNDAGGCRQPPLVFHRDTLSLLKSLEEKNFFIFFFLTFLPSPSPSPSLPSRNEIKRST